MEKLPSIMSKAASFGTSIHNALYKFYKLLLEREDASQTSLFEEPQETTLPNKQVLLECLDISWVGIGYDTKDEMYQRKKEALDILSTWYDKHHQDFGKPIYLETSFKIPIGDYIITGRFDRIDRVEGGKIEIIDYKTGKEKTQEEVDHDLQLTIYAKAAQDYLDEEVASLCLYYIGPDKKVSTKRSLTSIKEMEEYIQAIGDAINKEDFSPLPETKKCGYCDYHNVCPESKHDSFK